MNAKRKTDRNKSEKLNINILNWTVETGENFHTSITDKIAELERLKNSIISAEVDISSGINDFGNILYNTVFDICGVSKQINSGTAREKRNSLCFTHECVMARQGLKAANHQFHAFAAIRLGRCFLKSAEFIAK